MRPEGTGYARRRCLRMGTHRSTIERYKRRRGPHGQASPWMRPEGTGYAQRRCRRMGAHRSTIERYKRRRGPARSCYSSMAFCTACQPCSWSTVAPPPTSSLQPLSNAIIAQGSAASRADCRRATTDHRGPPRRRRLLWVATPTRGFSQSWAFATSTSCSGKCGCSGSTPQQRNMQFIHRGSTTSTYSAHLVGVRNDVVWVGHMECSPDCVTPLAPTGWAVI